MLPKRRVAAFVICALSAIFISIATADSSRVDLYRFGNASSPKMDNVRSTDLDTFQHNGVLWVVHETGGVSTFDNPKGQTKNVWRLPKGSSIPNRLKLVNDRDDHWTWMPAVDMPMTEFQEILREVGTRFVKFN